MRAGGPIGALVVLAAILAGASGPPGPAAARGAAGPAPANGPQEVEVVAVALDPHTQVPTVLIQGKRDRRNFRMVIGLAEAQGIALPLQGVIPPRPLTHDLFLTLFGRLNVTVSRAVITDLRDDTYYATLHLATGGGELVLDSRPSDAIALAVRARAPILVEDRVFDKAGAVAPPRRPYI